MTQALTVSLRGDDQPPRLVVRGEIDVATAKDFRRAVDQASARHRRFIVDLTDVTFLGSAGIGVLYGHIDNLVAVLVAPDSTIARALAISGFPRLVAVRSGGAIRLGRSAVGRRQQDAKSRKPADDAGQPV
jgi:anti-sigma B factor antagonist